MVCFFTKIRPWFVCLSSISIFADFFGFTNVYMNNWWLLLYFAISVTVPVLSVIMSIKSFGDYASFVRFVKWVLLLEVLCIAYQQGVNNYISSYFNFLSAFIIFIFVLVLGYFLWYRLNIKYFEKRIPMMSAQNDSVESEDSADDENDESDDLSDSDFIFDDTEELPVIEDIGATETFDETSENLDKFDVQKASETAYFCRKCGKKLAEDSVYCAYCGTKI